jgi:transcriptional regulator with GAF, ATPase, and Fis domain
MLHQITLDLLKERDMDNLLQAIVDQASKLLNTEIGYLTLKEGDLLVDRAFSPIDAPYHKISGKREEDTSPIWQVFDSGKPFITQDYSSTPGISQQTSAMGIKACMLLPLLSTETPAYLLPIVGCQLRSDFAHGRNSVHTCGGRIVAITH